MNDKKVYTIFDPDHQKEGEIEYIFENQVYVQWDDGCCTTHAKSTLIEDPNNNYDYII